MPITEAQLPVFLVPANSTLDRLPACDFCHANCITDILKAPGDASWSTPLRPIYRDTRPELCGLQVCRNCLDEGVYDEQES